MLRAALAEGAEWTALENWARSQGLSYSGWKVGEINGIRGAVATKSLQAGDVIVTAPKHSVLMVREGDSCPLPPDFINAQYWDEMVEYWNIRMALRLLYEKSLGDASSWKAYLDVMPASFSTPLNWADAEVQELQFAPLVNELLVEKAFFSSEARRMQQFLAQPIPQELFFWALSCAGSRTFTADFNDGGPTAEAMCPIADMVNHNEGSEPAFRWDDQQQAFELFSPLSVPRGGEVSISYGEVNNAHLLHYYGFIPGANVYNSVPITEHQIQMAAGQLDSQQGVRSEDVRKLRESVVQYLVSSPGGGLTLPLRPLLESWLDDKNNFSSENPGHTFDIKDDGNLGLLFVIYCRVWALTQADTVGRGGGWKLDALSLAKTLQSGRDLSAAHGGRWRQLASLTLNLHLSSMPTSFQDDLAIQANLDQGNPPEGWSGDVDNLATALRFRIAHKKILLDAIQSLEEDA